MKMVKSLLLGSAAGLVAIAGAQAADLPVKAVKAVEYVKVCSLYGAGFYYIPGTDTCLKVGGYVRLDVGINGGNSLSGGPFASGWNTHVADNQYVNRTFHYASFDARQQTAFGTVRAYLAVGNLGDSPAGPHTTPWNHRGFIQWAGLTLGQATSFFDFFNYGGYQYTSALWNDTASSGWRVAAYTAQLGGGLSASLSLEDPRKSTVLNGPYLVAAPVNAIETIRYPDVVANLRIDQAWGSAQIMGALHDASASYYNPATLASGRPGDAMGWALGAGVKLNLPMLSPGDSLSLQAVYSEGAFGYAAAGQRNFNAFNYQGGLPTADGRVALGLASDGIFTTGGSVNLTTAWSIAAAIEHFWMPNLRTSLWVNYLNVDYGNAANLILATGAAAGTTATNFDWSTFIVGSRTEWMITKTFSLGAEVAYHVLTPSSRGATVALPAANGRPAGAYTLNEQNEWSGRLRAQYAFVP